MASSPAFVQGLDRAIEGQDGQVIDGGSVFGVTARSGGHVQGARCRFLAGHPVCVVHSVLELFHLVKLPGAIDQSGQGQRALAIT